MPERETLERAREDKAEGKAPSTQAGEFIREEIHHIREGKHGARNAKQAIAIGSIKSPARGRQITAAQTRLRFGENAAQHRARHARGTRWPSQNFRCPFAGNLADVTARRARRGVASGIVAARA